jgi:hypothetical protein
LATYANSAAAAGATLYTSHAVTMMATTRAWLLPAERAILIRAEL